LKSTVIAGAGWRIPRLRWILASILLLVSIVNYLDRQTLSILATTIQADLRISNREYAFVVQAFLIAYTCMHLAGGRIVDALGPRIAETSFILWWSAANVLTSLATGFWSLAFFRTLLGLGEPGHYSASAKSVSEWFPPREKGIAVGMYTMGGTIGAALAAPIVALLAVKYGWRAAFVVTGLLGLVPALLWVSLYRRPLQHPWITDTERATLDAAGLMTPPPSGAKRISWRELFKLKPVWLIMAARMITDPLWYFYLFWFPKFLQEERSYSLAELGATIWVVYLSADIGCLLGGWLSGYFVRRGATPVAARLRALGIAAAVLAFSFSIALIPGKTAPLIIASLFTCAEMIWMTNCVTLPIDIFPSSIVGSVQGTIGAGGSLGGLFSTGVVGTLITSFSYAPVYAIMSFLHPVAFVLLFAFLPKAAAAQKVRNGTR